MTSVRSTARDARLLLAGALMAFLAMLLGLLFAAVFARAAGAHACVGDWRVEQWQTALDEGAILEIPRPELVDLPLCSEPDPDFEEAAPVTYAPPPPPAEIEAIIDAAFATNPVVSPAYAKQIAWCESRYNPAAKNRHSTAGGLFQFLKGTWEREAAYFGFPTDPVNRFDPVLSAQLASLVMERDGSARQWVCR